jgi:biotin transporter BioY
MLIGAVGSIGFLFHASHRTPRLLLALFVLWVLSPFVIGVLADAVSRRWSVLTRATLYGVMLVVTLGSLAIYLDDALKTRKAQAAFVFVAVPPASLLLIGIAVPAAALVSRKRSGLR